MNFGVEDRDNCPVFETVMPAGDFTLHATRTFGDAEPAFHAEIFETPVGGMTGPVPDGGFVAGGGLAAFDVDR